MAYQKVGTPRFYIDLLETNKTIGNIKRIRLRDDDGQQIEGYDTNEGNNFLFNLIGLNPESPTVLPLLEAEGTDNHKLGIEFDSSLIPSEKGFFGILNHNMGTTNTFSWTRVIFDPDDNSQSWFANSSPSVFEDILNGDIFNGYGRASDGKVGIVKNGSTIMKGMINSELPDKLKNIEVRFELNDPSEGDKQLSLGSIIFGTWYDMPVNPDLDLSMSIEYDGFTNIKTLSGHTITQANYQGSPWWYDIDGNKVEPWSVGESTGTSKRNGRRIWKLKFSYMSDKDLFASNYGSSTYLETDLNYGSDIDETNMGGEVILDGDFSEYTSADTGAGDVDCGLDLTQWNEGSNDDNYTITSITDGIRITSDLSPPVTNGLRRGWMHNVTQTITGKLTVGKRYHFEFYLRGSQDTDQGGNVTVSVRRSNSSDNFTEGQANGTFNADTFTKFEYDFDCNREIQDLRIVVWANNPNSGNWIEVKNMSLKSYEPDDFYYTIDNDDSFSAQVLNKISHGEKFIFQPDNTSNNPSDFAICVLDGDSFEMKRTAWNVYDIEMTIREVW